VQVPIDGLLYNAVPLRVKGRARGFVNGLVVPIGSLVGGLLLLLPLVATPWFVPGLIALVAIIYAGSSLVIRRLYSRALIEMLEQEDYSFLFSQEASDLSAADPAALASLELRLEESDDPDFIIFIVQLISQVGGGAAAPILRRALEKANSPLLKAALVDVMTAATNIRDQAILPLYTKLLTDPDGDVRRAALSGLEQLSGPKDPTFRKIVLDALHDPDAEVRMQAFSALIHSGEFYQIQPAEDALDQLLRADDPLAQAQGIRILGRIANFRAWQSLMSYLDSPADEVRLEALTAIESLPDGQGTVAVAAFLEEDTDLEEMRLTVEVADTGSGIAPENLELVFNDFFTTRKQGTGLGLSNVRRLAADCGARVHIKSEVDTGTTVTLSFPLARSAAS